MKIFVMLLLLANFTGWVWGVWNQRETIGPQSRLAGSAFSSARQGLQLLDVTKARVRGAPVTNKGVDQPTTEMDGPNLSDGGGSGSKPLVEAAPGIWCGRTTAFQGKNEAISWLSEWVRLGGQGSVVEKDEAVSSTWWVHLPPFPSESEAMVVLNELQGKKIDSYYMRTGDLAGGISLGVFSRKESAFLVQGDLEKGGYAASVKEIPRIAKRFTIALDLRERALIQTQQLQEFLREENLVEVYEMPCR